MIEASDAMEYRARALAARLGLPHTGFVLGRTRLHNRIESVRNGGVVTLVAGPGYGKTSYIVDFFSRVEARKAYVALDESDRDPVRFLGYLTAGLGIDLPDEAPSPPLGGSAPGELDAAVMEYAGGIVEHARERPSERIVLAIDDLHLVESSPQVCTALALVVRGLPPGWTVILSSRRPMPLQLDGLSLGGRLVRLGCRQLRLTPSEVAAWAAQNWHVELDPADVRAIWRLTQGWLASLVLLGQSLLADGPAAIRVRAGEVVAQAHDLRTYLKEDILAGFDSSAAEVLLTAGLLPQVVFPRDSSFFDGLPLEAENALEGLASTGYFVARLGRRRYAIHPLVRGLAETEARLHEQGIDLMNKVAGHLERQREHRHAARLYQCTGRQGDASRSLRSLVLSTLNAAASLRSEELQDLVSDWGTEEGTSEPWLLVAKARTLQEEAEYGRARTLYEEAARLLSDVGDKQGLLPVLLSSAFCLSVQGLWEESLSVLKRCWSVASTGEERAEVLVAEGSVLVGLCRWDEGVESWERALALVPEDQREAVSQRVYLGRTRLFHSLGHYRLAQSWVERIVAHGSGTAAPTRVMALNGAAIVACQTGDYDRAERLMNECRRLVHTNRYAFMAAPLLLGEASISMGRWDYRGAVAKCREAQSLAAKTGDTEQAYWAAQMLGDICRRNRNARRAAEHHRAALQIVDQSPLGAFERAQAETAIGMDLVMQGRDAEAERALEETVRTSRQWGLKGALVPSLFYLGWLHGRTGREQDAARCVGEAMRVAAEHEHVHFFCQEAKVAIPIFALCDRLGNGTFLRTKVVPFLPARLQEYFLTLATGKTYPTDVALGAPQRGHLMKAIAGGAEVLPDGGCTDSVAALIDTLTDREHEILRAIAEGMPNKVIGAKLFISEKTVKTHVNHIFRKLGVTSRLQAALVFQGHQRALAAGSAGRNRSG